MQKIEFETIIKNGVIKIPKEFMEWDNTKVKIVVLSKIDENNENIFDHATNEIIKNKDFMNDIKQGLKDKKLGNIYNWNDVK